MMLDRQKIGIAKAKSEGKYKGRVPTARKLEKEIQRLHLEGIKPSVIAKELNIGGRISLELAMIHSSEELVSLQSRQFPDRIHKKIDECTNFRRQVSPTRIIQSYVIGF